MGGRPTTADTADAETKELDKGASQAIDRPAQAEQHPRRDEMGGSVKDSAKT